MTECRCGYWNCSTARKAGWCEANGGTLASRPIHLLDSRELAKEAKYWRQHAIFSQEQWAKYRVALIEAELSKRRFAGVLGVG